MSALRKRPPVVAIAATALAVTAILYFVFLRGGSPAQTAQAVTPVATVEPAPAQPEPQPVQETDAIQPIRELADQAKWTDARAAVAKSFTSPMSDSYRSDLAALSQQIHAKLWAAPDSPDVDLYEIQSGDSLTKIANKSKTLKGCYGPLLLLNDLKEPNTTLRLGRKIRVPRGIWSIVVDKSLFTLWICYEGAPVRGYRVAIGTDEKTPAAAFTAGNKNPKPSWYPPQEMVPDLKKQRIPIPVPYGHEKNPLGEYWVALDHDQYSGLGIHGTNDPGSLGKKASNGCVRMDNRDVMMVAWTASPKMVVTIVE